MQIELTTDNIGSQMINIDTVVYSGHYGLLITLKCQELGIEVTSNSFTSAMDKLLKEITHVTTT